MVSRSKGIMPVDTKATRIILSPYAVKVCVMLAAGYKTDEIAEELHSNPHAIRQFIFRLVKKSRLETRTALIAWFCQSSEYYSYYLKSA